MTGRLQIVDVTAAHTAQITAITRAAFAKQYGSGDGEVKVIDDLRADDAVVVELAALEDSAVVGHAMFSRAQAAPPTLLVAALGPICARIGDQKRGIGAALIHEGLARCKALGFDVVAVLGDPAYYQKFGFTGDAARVLDSEYSGDHFQALELRDGALAGGRWRLTYPAAFAGD